MNLKYAVRMLVKDPWFTLVAVLALGLGIGVNSTVFTFVNAVLLRGLPFPNADQIVHVNGRNTADGNTQGVSYPDFVGLADAGQTLLVAGRVSADDDEHQRQRSSAGARERCQSDGERVQHPRAGSRSRPRFQGRRRSERAPNRSRYSATALEDPLRQRPQRHRPIHQDQRGPDDGRRRHGGGHEISHQRRPLDTARFRMPRWSAGTRAD